MRMLILLTLLFTVSISHAVLRGTCSEEVAKYCVKGTDCGLFFDSNLQPYDARLNMPHYLEELTRRVPEIKKAAQITGIDADLLLGTLLTANMKLPIEPQVRSTQSLNSGVRAENGQGSGARGGVGSGIRETQGLDSGIRQTQGLDSGIRETQGLDSGIRETQGLDSGKRSTNGLPSGMRGELPLSRYLNMGRLDHGGEMLAEEFLAQIQRRHVKTPDQVRMAIDSGDDILYAAALVARNREIFRNHNLTFDLPIAVTTYFLADLEKKAKKIQSERREPRANSFGLYAHCQQGLIDSILKTGGQ